VGFALFNSIETTQAASRQPDAPQRPASTLASLLHLASQPGSPEGPSQPRGEATPEPSPGPVPAIAVTLSLADVLRLIAPMGGPSSAFPFDASRAASRPQSAS
jgi:hypothetical protein